MFGYQRNLQFFDNDRWLLTSSDKCVLVWNLTSLTIMRVLWNYKSMAYMFKGFGQIMVGNRDTNQLEFLS